MSPTKSKAISPFATIFASFYINHLLPVIPVIFSLILLIFAETFQGKLLSRLVLLGTTATGKVIRT